MWRRAGMPASVILVRPRCSVRSDVSFCNVGQSCVVQLAAGQKQGLQLGQAAQRLQALARDRRVAAIERLQVGQRGQHCHQIVVGPGPLRSTSMTCPRGRA